MSIKNTVWILTEAYNEYDQHGEYYLGVFKDKPTDKQLARWHISSEEADHIRSGGGRRGWEESWYFLHEEEVL